jgi:hypothetical protein
MTTVLEKELKRLVTVEGQAYTVVIDPERVRLIAKGRRIPDVELHWRDLLSGEAALAVALNASISGASKKASLEDQETQPAKLKHQTKRPPQQPVVATAARGPKPSAKPQAKRKR